jgi:GNAT superfamily N-acetyltransferase
MSRHKNISIRQGLAADAPVIAALHAASWRIAYRGLLLDEYLDNDLAGERARHWSEKMANFKNNEFVLLAEIDNDVVGFIAVMDVPDAGYQALVDNLHVVPHLKGYGIGGKLMRAAAKKLLDDGRNNFYLWVLEGNHPAEKFYTSICGRSVDRKQSDFGGKETWATRYVWDDFGGLLAKGDIG